MMNLHRTVMALGATALLTVTAFAFQFDVRRVRVEDNDGKRTEKRLDLRGKTVRLARRFDGACREGRDWGYNRNAIWVKNYCKAEFEIIGDRDRDDWRPGRTRIVRLKDNDGRRTEKSMDLRGRRVELYRNLSPAPCREGRDWGYNDRGLWVSNRCKADFRITNR